eukprot:scaffold29864_cov63-Phaeocystis_antarctica.AAC.8
MHAAHGPPLAGYGITLLGVGGYGRAVRTHRPQPRLRWRGVKEYREQHESCAATELYHPWPPTKSRNRLLRWFGLLPLG